ncbi:hypothetical protein BC826DRAFT_1021517 [Russula brevipes]|nr:hypothetical protein BC826DRAFT_1021517 [Russula brevipes]
METYGSTPCYPVTSFHANTKPYSLIDGPANYTTISGTPISSGAHEISLYPPATPFYHDYKSLRQLAYGEDPFSVSHEGRSGGKVGGKERRGSERKFGGKPRAGVGLRKLPCPATACFPLRFSCVTTAHWPHGAEMCVTCLGPWDGLANSGDHSPLKALAPPVPAFAATAYAIPYLICAAYTYIRALYTPILGPHAWSTRPLIWQLRTVGDDHPGSPIRILFLFPPFFLRQDYSKGELAGAGVPPNCR